VRRNRCPAHAGHYVLLLFAIWLASAAAQGGTREITLTGCLLSSGYAGFQIEDATLDAIDGKAVDAEVRAKAPAKWILDGGGNLRRSTGQQVQVTGRSEWRADAKDDTPATPHLEVMSIKTIAAACT
jgi:hypothetical protein